MTAEGREPGSMAAIVATDGGMVERLLAAHVPDPTGHCRTCKIGQVPQVWPCSLHGLATDAQRIRDGR